MVRSLVRIFERERKMYWDKAERVRKGVQGEEMKIKDRLGNMLVEGNAVRDRLAEYFY